MSNGWINRTMDDRMREKRRVIDPDNRYPVFDGFRDAEHHAREVLGLLPDATFERTRDVFQIESRPDAEDGLVLLVTAEAIEIRLPITEWVCGSHGPAPSSRLWRRVPWDKARARKTGVAGLIESARCARRREFFTCPYCKCRVSRRNSAAGACHGCASEHLGVVF
jgi:hypothetical protein